MEKDKASRVGSGRIGASFEPEIWATLYVQPAIALDTAACMDKQKTERAPAQLQVQYQQSHERNTREYDHSYVVPESAACNLTAIVHCFDTVLITHLPTCT
jgi:hypothetical protein